MAFNRAGGGFSFQQEQVAHSSSYSNSNSRVPGPNTTNSRRTAAHSSSSSSSTTSSNSHHSTSPSPFSSFYSVSPSSARQQSYTYSSSSSSTRGPNVNSNASPQPFVDAQFDIFEWHVQYQSCVRYFLDHSQYSAPVQAVAAFVNIQLPFQRSVHPILTSQPRSGAPGASGGGPASRSAAVAAAAAAAAAAVTGGAAQPTAFVTLVPYIRRLIATAFDFPAVLHGFFGDDWMSGIGPIHETERRNYLFAAKSDNWLKVKADYDMDENQTVPFLRPLQNVSEDEIVNAETTWSEWLAMQDWMLGPRAPGDVGSGGGSSIRGRHVNIKREED